MAVPDYTALMVPLLRRAAKAPQGLREQELSQAVAGEIGLSPSDAARQLPAGGVRELDMQVQWARAYLEKEGFVTSAEGRLRVSAAGRDFLARMEPEVKPKPSAGHAGKIGDLHRLHRREVEEELLRRVHSMSPQFFEQLIIDLMLAMGYGGSRAGVARGLGRTGDGGVDGEVLRDELGLDRIFLQAKRYAPESTVPIGEVRDFAGALEAKRAGAGVFMSTAQFSDAARAFAGQLRTPLALVDGAELTGLMLRHGLGVRLVRTYALHHVDVDYFRE